MTARPADRTLDLPPLTHERIVIERGRRSGLPVIVAVHSTRLGPAVGGCRLWTYPDWHDGLDDALRLSSAMTVKNAAAGLKQGGGKALIAVPPGTTLDAGLRVDVMRDLGEVVDGFGGRFIVGEDVGTTGDDMLVVREMTQFVGGLPESAGGSGEPAAPTAVGVYAAIGATARRAFGSDDLAGRHVCVLGLGQVGQRLARRLADAGASLTVTDVDWSKRAIADELGARWAEPDDALFTDADLVVPAALGGILRADTVPRLRCSAIVGPANNQLADDSVADLLLERGIVWAPDFIANAGGVTYAVAVALEGRSAADAHAEVERIGPRLASIFDRAASAGVSPLDIAIADAHARLADAATES